MIAMVRTDSAEARWSALVLGSPALPEAGGLPAVLDMPSAGRLLGIGRTVAYRLAGAGEFPCRVLRGGVSVEGADGRSAGGVGASRAVCADCRRLARGRSQVESGSSRGDRAPARRRCWLAQAQG